MTVSADIQQQEATGPLSGIKVIELGTNFTAPLATMWLADQGADVIKIEAPIGDPTRYASGYREGVTGMASMFASSNRNKRGLMLDMKRKGATDAFRLLVKDADVVIHNFRPGVMERYGFGFDDLSKIKQDLVFVSITGFGETGPYSEQRAYDPIIQAISGMMSVQTDPDTQRPGQVRNAAADKITALVVFQAITAALFSKLRTGKGQHVRINMLNAVISFLWPDSMVNQTWLGEGARSAGSYKESRLVYKTKDNFIVVGGGTDAEWIAKCNAVNKPHLIGDPRFATIASRISNFGAVYQELKDGFLEKTTDELLEILRKHDCVCGPINTEEGLASDPQVIAAGLLVESQHPHAGLYRQPIHAAYFEETPASIRRHAPMLGEHTEEILREAGMKTNEIEELRNQGAIK